MFFLGPALELGKTACFFLTPQSFFFQPSELFLCGTSRGRGRLLRFKAGEIEVHAQLLQLAIPRFQLIRELLLRGLRCGLQLCQLGGERIDGIRRRRVLFNHGRCVLYGLDLCLERRDLCE